MPPNMVDTAAEEKAWKKAKARAAKEGHAEDWPYVVAIFQSMTGKKGTSKGPRLDPSTGMGDPSTWISATWKGPRGSTLSPLADYLSECGYMPVRVWVSFTGPGPIASPDVVSSNGGMAYGSPGR